MTLSTQSLITSNSISFHPRTDCSTRIWATGLISRPFAKNISNSSLLYAIEPPLPPSVYAGLNIRGNPILSPIFIPSSTLWAIPLFGMLTPISSIAFLNNSLSSAREMASTSAPIDSIPYFFKIPCFIRKNAKFNPVWPPKVGNIASGFSFFIISITVSILSGSIYVTSAILGSVIIVAGFELTSIVK